MCSTQSCKESGHEGDQGTRNRLQQVPQQIQLIEEVAKARGAGIRLEKVEQMQEIAGYGVMSTPGVVIDGQVVHAGGVPNRAKVEGWC